MTRHSMTSLQWRLSNAATYEDLFDLMDEVAAEYGYSDEEAHEFVTGYMIDREAAKIDQAKEQRRYGY